MLPGGEHGLSGEAGGEVTQTPSAGPPQRGPFGARDGMRLQLGPLPSLLRLLAPTSVRIPSSDLASSAPASSAPEIHDSRP